MAAKKVSSLNAKLTLNPDGFEAGLNKAKKSANKFTKSVKQDGEGIGAGISAGMVKAAAAIAAVGLTVDAILGKFTESFTRISEMSKTAFELNMKPEDFQVLDYAAKKTGVSIEELSKGIGKMPKLLADAQEEGSVIAQTFAKLHLNPNALQGLSSDEAFKTVISSLGNVENAQERAYLAQQVFGEEARKLLPLIGKDFNALANEANRFGVVLSGEQVAKIDLLKEKWAEFEAKSKATWDKLLIAMQPVLMKVLEFINSMTDVDGVVMTVTSAIIAMGDVGMDVWNGMKVGVGAFAVGALVAIQTVIRVVEELGTTLNTAIDGWIMMMDEVDQYFGGEGIKFRFGKMNLGSDTIGEFTDAMADEVGKAMDAIGQSKFSKLYDQMKTESDGAASARAAEKNAITGTTGAFDKLTAVSKEAAKAIEKSYKSTMNFEDIAKGKGVNAQYARRYLAKKKQADDAEAEGNFSYADKLYRQAEDYASAVNRRFKDDNGKELTRQGRSIGEWGVIPETSSLVGWKKKSGEAGGSRMEIKYADISATTDYIKTSTDLQQKSLDSQQRSTELMQRLCDKLGVR